MKVLTLIVGYDDGTIQSHYGIKHEDKLWLVTAWLKNLYTGVATPERMIRVDTPDQNVLECEAGSLFDYANILLPRAVIEDAYQEVQGYEVRNLPDSPKIPSADLKMLPNLFS